MVVTQSLYRFTLPAIEGEDGSEPLRNRNSDTIRVEATRNFGLGKDTKPISVQSDGYINASPIS